MRVWCACAVADGDVEEGLAIWWPCLGERTSDWVELVSPGIINRAARGQDPRDSTACGVCCQKLHTEHVAALVPHCSATAAALARLTKVQFEKGQCQTRCWAACWADCQGVVGPLSTTLPRGGYRGRGAAHFEKVCSICQAVHRPAVSGTIGTNAGAPQSASAASRRPLGHCPRPRSLLRPPHHRPKSACGMSKNMLGVEAHASFQAGKLSTTGAAAATVPPLSQPPLPLPQPQPQSLPQLLPPPRLGLTVPQQKRAPARFLPLTRPAAARGRRAGRL